MTEVHVRRRLASVAVVVAAIGSTAEIPPISAQARAGLDRVIGVKGVYIAEESAYRFTFPRADISVRVGQQRLSPSQAPQSWATFQPFMLREAAMAAELVLLDDEVNPVLSVALKSGLNVTGLGPALLSQQPRLLAMNVFGERTCQTLGSARARNVNISSIRNHIVGEHPQAMFVRVSGQGSASELARGLRYALDVQVGAVRPAER